MSDILVYIVIILCLCVIVINFQGQKHASKMIQHYNPNWQPRGFIWKMLWSLFKHKD